MEQTLHDIAREMTPEEDATDDQDAQQSMTELHHDISAFVLEPLTFGTNCSKVTGILYLTFPRSSIWDCEIEEGIESVRNRVDSYA